jgi:predicted permease
MRLRSLIDTLFRQSRLDRDLDEELRCAVEELAARHVARGMDAGAARRAALVELGGVEQVKEEVREGRIGHGVETMLRDVRYAWRSLFRTPGFAAVIILTLGLGIGTTTAIFTVVNALLLEPLPYRDADRLVFVWQDLTDAGYPRAPLAAPELLDLRHRATLFEGFGGIWANTASLTGDGDAEQLRIGLVTSNFFSVLGAEAALGRTFREDDETQSGSPGVVLAWPLFARRYGADPSVVGRRILMNGRPATVIGVMPQRFRLLLPQDASVPDDQQAWQLLNVSPRAPRAQQFIRVVGRMKPGVTLRAAQQEIADIAKQVGREFKDYGPSGATFCAVGLQDDGVREVRPALMALFGGVAILLLIACVNVASLLVTRAAARSHETALRMALGASRGRLVRLCVTEGLVLASLGGVAGLAAGKAGFAMLMAFRPASLARIEAAQMNPRVLAFAATVALVWGFLFSLAPLAELMRTTVSTAIQRARRSGAAPVRHRTRATLVVFQIALSVVLLVGAALLTRAFVRLQHVDVGFRPEGVLTFRVSLAGPRYRGQEPAAVFSRALRERLAALPGVVSVGAISHLPYDDLPNWGGPYLPEGKAAAFQSRVADSRAVSPGFFETAGTTLLDGRYFTEADLGTSDAVAIVDDQLARIAWPGEHAIGKRMQADPFTTGSASRWVTVVGVVKHLRHRRPSEDLGEQVYFPAAQSPRNPMAYLVRTSGDPAGPGGAIRDVVRQLDPQLAVYDVRSLAAYAGAARATRRFTMVLAAAFALVALVLACVGVYGVTAYSVALRRHEFGVRQALGARSGQIEALVLREGAGLAIGGVALGLIGAAGAATLLRAQLFGITPADPVSYAAAVPLLAVVALAASWIPARRATLTSPLESLRAD